MPTAIAACNQATIYNNIIISISILLQFTSYYALKYTTLARSQQMQNNNHKIKTNYVYDFIMKNIRK